MTKNIHLHVFYLCQTFNLQYYAGQTHTGRDKNNSNAKWSPRALLVSNKWAKMAYILILSNYFFGIIITLLFTVVGHGRIDVTLLLH